jgi:hypothetical protein
MVYELVAFDTSSRDGSGVPAHLEPVTSVENLRRGGNDNSLKTHCPRGHTYDEAEPDDVVPRSRLEQAEQLHVEQQAQTLEVAAAENTRAKEAEAQLAEARAALEKIASPGFMSKAYPAGSQFTGSYIDTEEPARVAVDALARLSSGEETP